MGFFGAVLERWFGCVDEWSQHARCGNPECRHTFGITWRDLRRDDLLPRLHLHVWCERCEEKIYVRVPDWIQRKVSIPVGNVRGR